MKLPQSVSNFLFSGFYLIGRAPVLETHMQFEKWVSSKTGFANKHQLRISVVTSFIFLSFSFISNGLFMVSSPVCGVACFVATTPRYMNSSRSVFLHKYREHGNTYREHGNTYAVVLENWLCDIPPTRGRTGGVVFPHRL